MNNELGIDETLLQEFEKLTDEEVKTDLRKRITEKHSRAPKPDINRSLKLLQQGYRDVKTGEGDEQHIKIPIHDIVTEILKCLKAGALAENIPIEVARGWKDGPAFDWNDVETRTWVYLRASRAGVGWSRRRHCGRWTQLYSDVRIGPSPSPVLILSGCWILSTNRK